MSYPSKGYIDKVISWTHGRLDLARIRMPLPGQFRARLCLEVYSLWLQNKTSDIRKMVTNIAKRDYSTLLQNAELGNEEARAMVEALGIRKDERTGIVLPRKETEISNDIYVINQMVGRLSVAKDHIQKAMYEDNIEWLMQFGRKTGNVTAVREAQRNLEKINNDFKDEQNPADAMKPGVDRNITGDVSIIKPDRSNYSEEEMRAFAKKIGARWEDVQEMYENQDGTYEEVKDDDEGDDYEETGNEPTDEPDTMEVFAN